MIFEKWGRAFDLSRVKFVRRTRYVVEVILDTDDKITVELKEFCADWSIDEMLTEQRVSEYYIDLVSEWKRYKDQNSQKVS